MRRGFDRLSVIAFVFHFRFLEQITVRNTKTKQICHFICNNWITPDEGENVATYSLKLMKEMPYTYTLRVKSLQSMRDQHLWLSIFVCPRHSTFTRVQRLSCGFALAMSGMLVNMIFYDVDMSHVHEELVYDVIKLDLSQFIIGAQSALITLPISMVTVLIFRSASPHNAKFEVRHGDHVASGSSECTSQSVTDSDTYASGSCESSSEVSDDINLKESHECNSKGSYESSSKGSYERSSKGSYECSSDVTESESSAHENKPKPKGFRLPWWWVIIGWTLAMGTSAVSSYIVLMYGLSFGFNKSMAWLISFLVATSNSIGIFQPFKVAAIVLTMTLLFKAPVEPIADVSPRVNVGRSFICRIAFLSLYVGACVCVNGQNHQTRNMCEIVIRK